jgi:predicted transcriptional regulator
MSEENREFIPLVADIVSAFVSNHTIAVNDVPNLVKLVHSSLTEIANGPSEAQAEPQAPAVSIKKSVTPDYIICLEDGKRFKSLKRHLSTHYNMSPDEYRQKWNLPRDYPMVAPAYAQARSELAKSMGLGQQRRKAAAAPAPAAKKSAGGRKKAAAA